MTADQLDLFSALLGNSDRVVEELLVVDTLRLFRRIPRLDFHPHVVGDSLGSRRMQRMLMSTGPGGLMQFVFVFEMSHYSLGLPGLISIIHGTSPLVGLV